jgi:putative MATE family efflux protein
MNSWAIVGIGASSGFFSGLENVRTLLFCAGGIHLAASMKFSILERRVLAIAAPAVVELLLTSLTSLVDTIMVGKLGAYAISAVGLTTQPKFILLSVFVALNVGTTALVARFRGQNNKSDADIVTVQSLFLTIGVAGILSVPGFLCARSAVLFMGAGPDTVDAAAGYFRIIMLGFVPTALPLTISALLRGVGETRLSMQYSAAANIVNVIFNYLLIYGHFGFPRLGVEGAAIATVIGNVVASGIALWAILGPRFHRNGKRGSEFVELKLNRRTLTPDFPMLWRLLRVGLPSAAEQAALRVGLLMYTITITGLGTAVFAAHQIVLTILNLSFVTGQAFGIAAASLAGQALGREDPEGAKAAAAASRRIGSVIATVMGILMFLFRRQLVSLFTDDQAIIALGVSIMILTALIQPFQSSFQIYAGALRGAGDSLYPAISLAVGILIIRPVLSYVSITVFGWGLFGAWCALFVDQTVRFGMIRHRFNTGKWLVKKV